MAKDMFGNLPTAIPKDSPTIQRVPLDKADQGARMSHLPKLERNPKQQIKHVTQGR
jgi:hypothetical protein